MAIVGFSDIPPNVKAEISADHVKKRLVIGKPMPHGARREVLSFGWAGSPFPVLAGTESFAAFVPVPTGEVWTVLYAYLQMTSSEGDLWNASIRLARKQMTGIITTPPDIKWAPATFDSYFIASETQAISQSGGVATAEWHSRENLAIFGGEANIALPIWEGGERVAFWAENTRGINQTVSSFGIKLLMIRTPLGDTLLEELRATSTSDLEIQRKLQATGVCGIPQYPITLGTGGF